MHVEPGDGRTVEEGQAQTDPGETQEDATQRGLLPRLLAVAFGFSLIVAYSAWRGFEVGPRSPASPEDLAAKEAYLRAALFDDPELAARVSSAEVVSLARELLSIEAAAEENWIRTVSRASTSKTMIMDFSLQDIGYGDGSALATLRQRVSARTAAEISVCQLPPCPSSLLADEQAATETAAWSSASLTTGAASEWQSLEGVELLDRAINVACQASPGYPNGRDTRGMPWMQGTTDVTNMTDINHTTAKPTPSAPLPVLSGSLVLPMGTATP